ncbi:unnamed protein product [Caenorhabditis brenneri]
MILLAVTMTTLAVITSGYQFQAPSFVQYHLEDDSYHHQHPHYRKLTNLKGTGIFPADIEYYYGNDDNAYAVISCKQNPNPKWMTFIVISSEDKIQEKFLNYLGGVTGVAPLALGTTVTTTVKYDKDGKWTGNDMFFYKWHKFSKVGCLFSGGQTENLSIVD